MNILAYLLFLIINIFNKLKYYQHGVGIGQQLLLNEASMAAKTCIFVQIWLVDG